MKNTKNDHDDPELQAALKASAESFKIEKKTNNIGPRSIDGWEIQDVIDDGNCFYYALIDQMACISHEFLKKIDKSKELHDALRQTISPNSKDKTWADYNEIKEFATKFNLIIAIVDTRTYNNSNDHKFIYYYVDNNGEFQSSNQENNLPSNQKIVRLAFNGNHYMSVRKTPNEVMKSREEQANFNLAKKLDEQYKLEDKQQKLQIENDDTLSTSTPSKNNNNNNNNNNKAKVAGSNLYNPITLFYNLIKRILYKNDNTNNHNNSPKNK